MNELNVPILDFQKIFFFVHLNYFIFETVNNRRIVLSLNNYLIFLFVVLPLQWWAIVECHTRHVSGERKMQIMVVGVKRMKAGTKMIRLNIFIPEKHSINWKYSSISTLYYVTKYCIISKYIIILTFALLLGF